MRWRTIAKDLRGPFWHQFSLPPEIQHACRVTDALDEIERKWPTCAESGEDTDISPVFILSAGWGAGSTLLQRLIMSSGEVLVWGEPFDQAAIDRKSVV